MDVSEKQRRLSQKAEQDQAWRFFDLYSLLYNPIGYGPRMRMSKAMLAAKRQGAMASQ